MITLPSAFGYVAPWTGRRPTRRPTRLRRLKTPGNSNSSIIGTTFREARGGQNSLSG